MIYEEEISGSRLRQINGLLNETKCTQNFITMHATEYDASKQKYIVLRKNILCLRFKPFVIFLRLKSNTHLHILCLTSKKKEKKEKN